MGPARPGDLHLAPFDERLDQGDDLRVLAVFGKRAGQHVQRKPRHVEDDLVLGILFEHLQDRQIAPVDDVGYLRKGEFRVEEVCVKQQRGIYHIVTHPEGY